MTETVLVVSPHLDDAVLSIGASIAAWTAAGARVVIASVYTTGPALAEIAPSMRKFADYEQRRAEDAEACTIVGAEVRRLDQIERAFRKPYLSGWSFFATPAGRSGFATLGSVTEALAPLAELAPDRILVPLGVGNHIDHVETLIATTDWAHARGWLDRVSFYEDFYALSGTMRRRHFVAALRVWRHRESPLLRARRLAVILSTIAAARRGPEVETFLLAALRTADWTLTTTNVRGHEQRQLDAIARYPSQTRAFGGFPGIEKAIRASHAWWGHAEPLWRPRLR
ncbi:MAG: PIG-L family deacetylase [Deltaproteobacteria bacterium]|nr:PIG-L family deacetylase [Deltaproteobacteria bacterium]